MRPVITCFIGVVLAIALNKVTSYYTHTTHAPVKSLAKACQTGHATNIIQGIAVGYESTVAMVVVIAIAILLSFLCYAGTPPLFVAYGVAMTGIGMLTLTGNTISMDVFGPVADNANGIGEMGYDAEAMEKAEKGSYSAPARFSPTSMRWATPPRPRPRASPSAPPSSPLFRSSPPSSPSSRWQRRQDHFDDHRAVPHRSRQAHRGASDGLHRLPHRWRRAVPFQLDAHPRRRSRRLPHRERVPRPVPG